MRVLALEPYYGGSHRAFLDGWSRHSTHDFTVLSLPAHKWKWRMRHSAISFAKLVREYVIDGAAAWDGIFCSDMLPLAEFRGLAPSCVADLPAVLYFHENQLTYPNRTAFQQGERDHHFAFTNFVSAIAADAIWFNSEFHRGEFFSNFAKFLERMPDNAPLDQLSTIQQRSQVQAPGINVIGPRSERAPGPLRILWNARWEHDKNPELFFAALRQLRCTNEFRLTVAGESFREVPEVFAAAKSEFASVIDHWGFASDPETYRELLRSADVVVSTALHEFFGIAILEAAAAGVVPIVPSRLAYPEIFVAGHDDNEPFFYDGTSRALIQRLSEFIELVKRQDSSNDPLRELRRRAIQLASGFAWPHRAKRMDEILAATVRLS